MIKKLRTVITSDRAKEHIVTARSLMNEMNNSMSIHKQNIAGEKRKEEDFNREYQKENEKMTIQNDHEFAMQEAKLNSINSLT